MALKATTRGRWGMTILAWLVGFLIFFPILWTFLTSFKSEADAYAIPPKFLFFHWTTENYAEVQSRTDYVLHAFNSIVLSVGANLFGLLIASRAPGLWQIRRPRLALARGNFAETGGDHGDLHGLLHGIVHHRAENNVGVLVRGLLDDRRGLVNFLQGEG